MFNSEKIKFITKILAAQSIPFSSGHGNKNWL